MKSKSFLRSEAKRLKGEIDLSAISNVIQTKILELDVVKCSNTVLLYMPLGDEIKTDMMSDTLSSFGKICCFPVVSGDDLLIKSFSDRGFIKGAFGILEPLGDIVVPDLIDVVIVPGVMFDTNFNRLGRGGGYYDRFLRGLKSFKIGICPDALLVDNLPCESHDISVDMVVTEKRMICSGR